MALLKSNRQTKEDIKGVIKKAKKTAPSQSKIKGGLHDKIQAMISFVNTKLGKYRDYYIVIRTVEELESYFDSFSELQKVAIDTETTSLDPLTTTIAGLSLYTKDNKACYIPLNHVSHVTGERLKNQLNVEVVKQYLEKYKNCRWIMHNAKFDTRVIKHTVGVDLTCWWDTSVCARLLDENEPAGLKEQHAKYCADEKEEALKFSTLFDDIEFTKVPIDTAYLYAAGDAIKTFDLYEFQTKAFEDSDLSRVYEVFTNIEMPLIPVVAEMEDVGMAFDFEISNGLVEKYGAIRENKLKEALEVIESYSDLIENYKFRNTSHKLSDPINLASPSQLAVLFYDILGLTSPDKNSPRGTGEEILLELAKGKERKLCEAILNLREVEKLLSTYVNKMPELATRDGRIHASFNQLGAKTGRFSSSDPNLQNIPSHNKEIRQMFKATPGYVLIGADYSKQEIFIAASISQDVKMIESCKKNTDIYSEIASIAFNLPYDECVEFRPDGTKNNEGKERRGQAKAIVLGILYGKGVAAIATDLSITKEKAKDVYDKVLKAFPKLKDFMNDSQECARVKGYVETAWGRRRHLPDMQLDKYEFKLLNNTPIDFDPLDFTEGSTESLTVPSRIKNIYIEKLDKCYGNKAKEAVKAEARSKGIQIKDNGGFIAQAERQCVNSRVQGSAGDVTKLAMIAVGNDEELKQLGFRLLLTIHDELIGECPAENAKLASERFAYLMIEVAKEVIAVPMMVDVELSYNWNGKVVEL